MLARGAKISFSSVGVLPLLTVGLKATANSKPTLLLLFFCAVGAWNRANNMGQPVAVTTNIRQPLCYAALHKAHLTLSQTKAS